MLGSTFEVAAQERLCDTRYEDCRAPLIDLIRKETQAIDVAFWFIEDGRYVTELINRHKAGVPVRILVDQRANTSKRLNESFLATLRDSGIPMRDKFCCSTNDILHFKMMLFHGQNVVEFSKANYTPYSFVPDVPNVNYFDETIFFTDDYNLTNSFRRRFDDLWIDTSRVRDFANLTGPPARRYDSYCLNTQWADPAAGGRCRIHSSMNFVPLQSFSNRSVARYNAETIGIDALVFRVTDHRQANAAINAVARGVRVRVITEPEEYRNPKRLWHSKHLDRMWLAGVQIKDRKHEGLMHQASVVMHGLGEVIFGSANWTDSSGFYQDEHNYFYNPSLGKQWFFDWFAVQFESKWNDTNAFALFQPLPPDPPIYSSPQNGVSGLSSSATLNWDGGTWGHLYDIYFGTTPNPPLIAKDMELGSPVAGQRETYTVTNLLPGTTYYWRIVGKTWAQLGKSGPTWSFTTAGTGPGGGITPYGGTPVALPGTFQAENFDDGGQFAAYFDAVAGNSGGAYRSTDVDIEPTSDAGGGHDVGWTRAGEWLKYTVNVAATATYTLETRVANIGTGARFHLEVDGVDRSGPITVPDTGGWQAWQTITKTGISLTAGSRVLRIAFDSVGSGGAAGNYNWFRLVQTAPVSGPTPYGGTPANLPGSFQAENFDEGGQSVAYNDSSTTNSGGVYRSTAVDIQSTTDSGGGYNVGWTKAGEWLKYTVNVAATGTYTLEIRVANIGTGARFHVEVDDVDRSGSIAVPDTGGWQTWQTITKTGIPLTAGSRVIRVVFDSAGSGGGVGNYNWFRLAEEIAPSGLSTPFGGTRVALPGIVQAEAFDDGAEGVAYHDTAAGNSGGTYRTTNVDVGATSDAANGGYYVGWTRPGEWLKYTVDVTATRTYTLDVRVANVGSGATFRIDVDGVDRTGAISVADTGGWDLWHTLSVSNVPLTQGARVIQLVMLTGNVQNNGAGNYGYLAFQ